MNYEALQQIGLLELEKDRFVWKICSYVSQIRQSILDGSHDNSERFQNALYFLRQSLPPECEDMAGQSDRVRKLEEEVKELKADLGQVCSDSKFEMEKLSLRSSVAINGIRKEHDKVQQNISADIKKQVQIETKRRQKEAAKLKEHFYDFEKTTKLSICVLEKAWTTSRKLLVKVLASQTTGDSEPPQPVLLAKKVEEGSDNVRGETEGMGTESFEVGGATTKVEETSEQMGTTASHQLSLQATTQSQPKQPHQNPYNPPNDLYFTEWHQMGQPHRNRYNPPNDLYFPEQHQMGRPHQNQYNLPTRGWTTIPRTVTEQLLSSTVLDVGVEGKMGEDIHKKGEISPSVTNYSLNNNYYWPPLNNNGMQHQRIHPRFYPFQSSFQ